MNPVGIFSNLGGIFTREGPVNTDDTQNLRCPGCQSELEIDAEYYQELAGTEIACPECDTRIQVPSPTLPAKKLGLMGAAPDPGDGAAGPGTDEAVRCPNCGADFPDPEAVLCMACGTNRETGKQVTGLESAPASAKRGKPPMTPRRMLTGVVAVVVIVVCAVRGYLIYTKNEIKLQTQELAAVVAGSEATQDYARAVTNLEKALADNPRAEHRDIAEASLVRSRANLEEVPARTETLQAAIAAAREQTDLAEAIRSLNAAIQANPGASNTSEARTLLERLRAAR